jgi:hypothetical protein
LCIGRGYYSIPVDGIKIGGTEILNFDTNAVYAIYEPGDSLAADQCADWWHTVPEVGGTTNGSAGLHIKTETAIEQYPTGDSLIFDNYTVTMPAGAGTFPAAWAAGMTVIICTVRDYEVELGSGARALIRADLDQDFAELMPYVGMKISIWGNSNAGDYTIYSYVPRSGAVRAQIRLSYDNGDPVYALELGMQKFAIGYRNFQYEIVTASTSAITVERITDTGVMESGWVGFDYLESTLSLTALDYSDTLGTWTGPYAACPAGELTDTIEVDIFFPNGLGRVRDNGSTGKRRVDLQIQYRDIDIGGAWTTASTYYEYQSFDQLGFTEVIDIGYMIRPEVRVRRTGEESTDNKISDRVEWYALKSKLVAPTSYEGVTTMTLQLRTGDRIAATGENLITVESTRKLPELSGSTWSANTATRSIISYMAYVAKDIGYVDAQLDLTTMDALDTLWASRGDYYDWAHDASTVRDTINQVLQAGFAMMTISGGKLKPVRDADRATLEQMYTPQNMTEPMRRSVSAVRPDDIDGVDVEYIDSTTWTRQTVQCRLPGDAGVQVQTITLNGVTSRTRAWRIGMRIRREVKYRRWRYEFSTELDGLVSNYLSYCYVADDVPGYAKSCLVTGADTVSGGVMLTVTEPIDITSNSIVSLRDEDGTIDGPYIAEAGNTDFLIKAVGLAVAPTINYSQELTHALIGDSTRYAFEVLITEIKPNGFDNVNLVAVNYDSRVYDDDDNAP